MSTNGLHRRVSQLENATGQQQTQDEEWAAAVEASIQLCEDILEAIDAGFIVNYIYLDTGRECIGAPTTANGLQDPDYTHYWRLKTSMEGLVEWWVSVSGWRSPLAKSWEVWKQYRANNVDEMAAIARDIILALGGEDGT